MKIKAKAVAVASGLAMAMSMLSFAPMASAASLTSAQVSAIVSLLQSFGADSATIANVNASLTGGSPVMTGPVLGIGSKGAAVTALQKELIAAGYSIPAIAAGAAYGYYGTQTAAAVAARAAAMVVVTPPASTVAGCSAGAMFSSTTGQACASGTTTTTTSTPGAEGSFTISQAAQPANDTNVTKNTDVSVYGVKVKAAGSNMVIDRADLEFGVTVNSSLVNPSQFITSISAWDGSTRLKTMPITSADVIKDSNNLYYVRVTGIGFNVPKGDEKTLTFSINTNSVGTSDYSRAVTVKGSTVGSNDIRGTDGAGLNTYADAGWTSSFTFTASNNSTLTGTANSASTPKAQTLAVNTTDGVKGVVMQTVDLKSTVGDSTLTDMRVYVKTDGVSTSAPTSLFLYDGSTLLGSASVTVTSGSGTVNFTNMKVAVAKDVTKTLTVKADFPSTAVGVASTTIATSASETNTTMFETADGTSKEVTIASAITGNDVHMYAVAAPVWTLVSTTMTPTAGVVSVASSSLTGVITLKVTANGGTLTKPVIGDFSMWFASSTQRTTNGGTGYSAANAIAAAATSVTVTPTDATVGDGSSYTVALSGTLYSSNASFGVAVGSGYSEFMAIENVKAVVGATTITTQGWGIDSFYTPAALLTKGTQ